MPVGFFYPEIFLKHEGITLYHIYKNDNQTEGISSTQYGYSPYCSAEGLDCLDVKDLLNYQEDLSHEVMLKEAIEKGWITEKGYIHKWNCKDHGWNVDGTPLYKKGA